VDYKNSYSPKVCKHPFKNSFDEKVANLQQNDAGLPLVHNFTILTRTLSKEYLSQQPKTKFGLLSPAEEPIVNHFGEPISIIMKDCLKRWARAMRVKLKGDPDIRPIREREHVNLIMEYLNVFQEGYEAVFGTMERNMHSPLGQIKDNTVHIRSTGYAAKVFLGLLMADRLHVVEKLRREERERIGFVEMDEGEVEADSKNCPVCQDPMGVENPEGEKESPIRLVICCGQVIGENCMKQWLSEFAYEGAQRDSCPVCRFQFPESFMRTLFDTEDDEQSSDGDEDVELGNADDDEEYADRGIPDAQPTELIDLISDEDVEVPDAQPREVINLVSPLPSPLRHRNSRARSTPAVLYSAVDLTRLVFQNSAHVDDGAYRGPSWGLMMAEADVMEDDARMLEG